jgi:hypothetical protein
MMVLEIVVGLDVQLHGFAGRRLAHEHACPAFPHNGRGVLFRTNPRPAMRVSVSAPEKFGVLGGFTSAVVLAIVALLMAVNLCTGFLSRWKFTSTRQSGIACLGLL